MKKLNNLSNLLIISLLLILSVGVISYMQTNQQPTSPNVVLVSATVPSPTAITTATATATATATPPLPTFTPPPPITNDTLPTRKELATLTPTPDTTPKYPVPETEFLVVTHEWPTPWPTPTVTPTFEPLHGQSIGGYIFSEARLVPNTQGYAYDLVQWLPDDPNKVMLINASSSIEIININTGEKQVYSDGTTSVYNPVWLPTKQQVVYLTTDNTSHQTSYLWLSGEVASQNKAQKKTLLTITTMLPPLVLSTDGTSIILFDTDWNMIQVESNTANQLKLITNIQKYKPLHQGHGMLFKVAQSPDKTKAIYFNERWLLLADFTQNTLIPLDLVSLYPPHKPPIEPTTIENRYPTDPIIDVIWHPYENKIAIQLFAMYSTNHLLILDLTTNTLTEVEDHLKYIGSMVWTPDGEQILMTSYIGTKEIFGLLALFSLNLTTGNRIAVAAIPNGAVGQSSTLHWSPDKKHIAILFGILSPQQKWDVEQGLYIIDVKKP